MSEWETAARILGKMVAGLMTVIIDAIRGDDGARARLLTAVPESTRGDIEAELDEAALAAKFGSDR